MPERYRRAGIHNGVWQGTVPLVIQCHQSQVGVARDISDCVGIILAFSSLLSGKKFACTSAANPMGVFPRKLARGESTWMCSAFRSEESMLP